jgi:hypothetical protein
MIGEVGEGKVAMIAKTSDSVTRDDDLHERFHPRLVSELAHRPRRVMSPKVGQVEGSFDVPPESQGRAFLVKLRVVSGDGRDQDHVHVNWQEYTAKC